MIVVRPVIRAIVWTVLLLGLMFACWQLITVQHRQAEEAVLSQTREQLILGQFDDTRIAVERLFSLGYQTLRTISLLPSVRTIHGANRTNDSENVVRDGRFTAEGAATVQQLYNNLAANAAVSEVYAIVKGLQPGQIPFFMYDQLILQTAQASSEAEAVANADTPEESEEAEYQYYPTQIAYFDQASPRYKFDSMDAIPAVSSPAMRTCDNTQYLSKRFGDVHNADGILYSVPFYSEAGELRGIISAIFRINVLEALLLHVPFIPVTEADKKRAAEEQVFLPDQPGHFVLVNARNNVYVADRRNSGLVAAVRQAVSNGDTGGQLYHQPLAIKDSGTWELYYEYDPVVLAEAMAPLQQQYRLKQWGLLGFGVFALLWIVEDYVRRSRLMKAAAQLQDMAAGRLHQRAAIKAGAELGKLLQALHLMEKQMVQVVRTVSAGARSLSDASVDIARGNADLAERTQDNAVGLEEITANVRSLADVVHQTTQKTLQVETLAISASDSSAAGLHEIDSVVAAMSQIRQHGAHISKIVDMVEEISSTTNILALNAELEAARAGIAGKGFAVVASEIRQLAARSALSTREIRKLVVETTQAIDSGSDLVQQAGNALVDIEKAVREVRNHVQVIASTTRSQELGIEEVMRVLDTLAEATAQNAALVQQIAAASAALDEEASALKRETDYFTLMDD